MTELEQALHQELTRLRSAVSYVEEANQHTREALQAAHDMRMQNALLLEELAMLRQKLTQLEAKPAPPVMLPQALLVAGIGSLLLLGCGSWRRC